MAFSLFKNLRPGSKKLSYEEEKKIAREGNEKERLKLASNKKASPEILYYLAEKDESKMVRMAVATNESVPVQASLILAKDKSEDVRVTIAARLMSLLPTLPEDRHGQLYAFTVQAMATIALDEVLVVRKALAETLKDQANVPPDVALQLAKDLERQVAEPILRFCAILPDKDLIEIIKTHKSAWASEAIAQRAPMSEAVMTALFEGEFAGTAGAYLLKNKNVMVPLSMLTKIIDRAREFPEWHEPIAIRKDLPPAMAIKLAEFVDDRVRNLLLTRGDFDKETAKSIASVMRRRVQFEQQNNVMKDVGATPMIRAQVLFKDGRLDEKTMGDALAMRDKDFVIASLALLADTDEETVRNVFDARAARSICAIAWRAGLSMRFALKLQQQMGQVRSKDTLYPRGGSDYPLTEEQLHWQLDFLGIKS